MDKAAVRRKSSIELLRILAVMGVVFLHYNNANRGGALRFVEAGSAGQYYLFLMETLSICAVNVFVLISAYFLSVTEERKLIKIVELLIQVFVFRVIFYFGDILTSETILTKKGLLEAVLPVDYYVILYLVLYIVSPYINLMLKKLGKQSFKKLLITLFVIFSIWTIAVDILENIYGRTLYGLSTIGMDGSQYGYTIVNFAFLYLLGAYLRRYSVSITKAKAVIGIAVCFLVIYAGAIVESFLPFRRIASWGYNNPFVIAMAVFAFLLFNQMSFQSRVINELARAVFTCYLFHEFFFRFCFIEKIVSGGNVLLMFLHQFACVIVLFLASYVAFKIYYLCSHWLIKLLTPLCNKVKISPEGESS